MWREDRMVLFVFCQGISDADNHGDYGKLAYKSGLLRAVKNEQAGAV
jgi:hypothetical protein